MAEKPNIILITVDSLRADHLGFMGYEKNVSPNMDELAKESVVFTNAYATGPATPYSFPSIMTSSYPLDYQGLKKIERPRVLISEVLKKQGFVTAAFHSNGFLSGFFGYDRGWDFFEDIAFSRVLQKLKVSKIKIFAKTLVKKVLLVSFPELFLLMQYKRYKKRSSSFYDKLKYKASYLNQIAENFIDSLEERKPFFVWIHYMDVHFPYLPLDSYLNNKIPSFRQFVSSEPDIISYVSAFPYKITLKGLARGHLQERKDLYDQGIKYFDQELKNFLNFLKERNIYENSVILLTADHGDEFLEHGRGNHSAPHLYNELLHVPLLAKVPGRGHEIIKEQVSLIDLAPTICDVLGVERDSSFKGENLFQRSDSPVFGQTGFEKKQGKGGPFANISNVRQSKISCQFRGWKYILDHHDGREELYNLSEDPKEQNNLSEKNREALLKMRKMIRDFEEKNPPFSLVNKNS